MDEQNFNNEQNEQNPYMQNIAPTNNYQDYTENVSQSNNYQDYMTNASQPNNNQNNTLSIVSLVLGILSILTCCCGGLGVLLGVAGIVCAVLANKQGKCGMATGGLVCSIIGTIFGVLYFLFWIFAMVAGSM